MEKWIRIHNRNAGVGFYCSFAGFWVCVYMWECDIRVNMCAAPLRMCEFAVIVGGFFFSFLQGGVGEEV